jgi:hypothetical protein
MTMIREIDTDFSNTCATHVVRCECRNTHTKAVIVDVKDYNAINHDKVTKLEMRYRKPGTVVVVYYN